MPVIQLHTVGDALIVVGDREIRPSTASHAFATLLYLSEARGRRVPRVELHELLFPTASERKSAHSVRQLVYRLKQQGAAIDADGGSVSIAPDAVADVFPWDAPVSADPETLQRLARGYLPGYLPAISPAYEHWVDELRTARTARIRALLLAALARARESGSHSDTHNIAAALLTLDPLNEEATLARAESLALAGQKHDAVRLLDAYAGEVGSTPELRVAPETLRRRIADRLDGSERARTPLVGRAEELAWLLAQFARAAAGVPTVTVLWGEAGLGKTRLVEELRAHVALRGTRMQTVHCQPHDVERPLGALVDLLPKLLEIRGALGVAPDSMEVLRRFAGGERVEGQSAEKVLDPELLSAKVRAAFADLIGCITSEGALVLRVEDAHWLDSASLRLLQTTVLQARGPLHLLLTRRGQPRFPDGTKESESVFVRQLEPLTDASSAELLARLVGEERRLDATIVGQCVALGGGNPLFLCTIAEHLRLRGTAPSMEASITDLLRQRIRVLDPRALLLLRCVAAFGTHGTRRRLVACTGMTAEAELLALQEVADRGLVVRESGEAVRCSHIVLAETVLGDTPLAVRTVLFERVATMLEEDGINGKQVSLLWSCAESWRLAENPERALRALERCAEFAVEIGQPTFALSALENARELATGDKRISLTEEAIRLADVAGNAAALLRNAEHFKSLLRSRGELPPPHHPSELAETNALLMTQQFTIEHRDQVWRCALDRAAPKPHRLRAARQVLVWADFHFDKAVAVRLWKDVQAIGDLVHDRSDRDVLSVSLVFNHNFGDLDDAYADAEAVLPFRRKREGARPWETLAEVAEVFFLCNATERALDVMQESVQLNVKAGAVRKLYIDYDHLVFFHIFLGNLAEARHWHEQAGKQFALLGEERSASRQLVNAIDIAVAERDVATAERSLALLKAKEAWMESHFAYRTFVTFDVMIALAKGEHTLASTPFDLDAMLRFDLNGREHSYYHGFAVALFLVDRSRGNVERARRRLREYVHVWRRDRFPFLPWLAMIPLSRELRDEIEQTVGTPPERPAALSGAERHVGASAG